MFWRGLSPPYQLKGFEDNAYFVIVVFKVLSLKKGPIVALWVVAGTVLQT